MTAGRTGDIIFSLERRTDASGFALSASFSARTALMSRFCAEVLVDLPQTGGRRPLTR